MDESLALGIYVVAGAAVGFVLIIAGREFVRGLKIGKAEFDAAAKASSEAPDRAAPDETKEKSSHRSDER